MDIDPPRMSPKSVALPKVANVIKSIIFDDEGSALVPPINNPLVALLHLAYLAVCVV